MVSGIMHSFSFLRMLNIFQAFHSEELFFLFFGLFKGTIKALVKKVLLPRKWQLHHQSLQRKKKEETSEKVHGKVSEAEPPWCLHPHSHLFQASSKL